MHTPTRAWRLALVAALTLLTAPWASAQKRVAQAPGRAEASAQVLGLPAALPEAPASFLPPILNETFSATFTGSPPAPPGWIQLRAGTTSTTPDWTRVTSAPCSSANPCARSAEASGGASRRYLVSPQVTPSAAAGNLLTFRLAQTYGSEYLSTIRVAVTTGSPTVTNFDAAGATLRTIGESSIPVGSFGSFSVDLSAYNGQAIYIAIVHSQNFGDTIYLDDVLIAEPAPATFTSTTLQFQNTGTAGVVAADEDIWVVGANIVIGGTVGTLPVTEMTFTTTGTTDVSDITSARLLYSGSSTSFSYQTTPLFGSPVVNPNGTITFTGSQALSPGNNYFILVYNTSEDAVVGNLLDATYESAVVDGVSRTPTATTATGAVTIVTRPVNDDLLAARPITATATAFRGSTVNASFESGELLPSCQSTVGGSLWWVYTPSTSGTATFSTAGSTLVGTTSPDNFDTVLSVHTGTGHPLTERACDDDTGPSNTSQITGFAVTAGTTYYIRASGYGTDNGTIVLTVTGPAPEAGDFTFSRPTAGQAFAIGGRLKPIWSDVSSATDVRVSLCRTSTVTCVVTYEGSNLEQPDFGDAVYIIPESTAPANDYYLLVQDVADPSSYGVSSTFTIYDADDVYVVTGPTEAAVGSPLTLTWSSASSSTGTVDVTITSAAGATVQSFSTADDGSETFTLDAAATQGNYRVSICPAGDPSSVTCGSARIRVRNVLVTEPDAGDLWTAGSTQTVSWTSSFCSGSATADIYLRRASGGRVLLANDEACDGTTEVTVPEGTEDGIDYFVQVQVYDGSTRVATGNSATFTVGTPIRVAGAPMVSGTADAFVRVATPGLADGTEVSVRAGTLVLGTGVVRGGAAEVVLFGTVVDASLVASGLTAEEALETVAVGTELTVTTWNGAADVAYAIGTVTDANGRTTNALTFAYGADLTVAAKGGAASTAAVFAVAGVSPNPAAGAATVRFSLPEARAVTVTVYDALGRTVATVFEGEGAIGANVATVPSGLPAGVYVVRVVSGTDVATARFTVVR